MTDSNAEDHVGAGHRWIKQGDYDLIRASVPIVCVDVLLRLAADPNQVGLIRRVTYDRKEGWCLVGGRVLLNESLREAVERQLRVSVPGVNPRMPTLGFVDMFEYFSAAGRGRLHDPRKHDIGLTFAVDCEGTGRPQGEALEFRWWHRDELAGLSFGFGHGEVVSSLIRADDEGARQHRWGIGM